VYYLTRNPKSPAEKELKLFNDSSIKQKLVKTQFLEQIQTYLKTHQDYLSEMSETDPKQYKHQRLHKAFNKYKNNIKYIFTYQNQTRTKLVMPNTTNHIDGGVFPQMKNLLNNPSGTTKERRKQMIILF
jgi:hypothetical protein